MNCWWWLRWHQWETVFVYAFTAEQRCRACERVRFVDPAVLVEKEVLALLQPTKEKVQ